MKAITLTLATLCLAVAATQTGVDEYHLRCTQEEIFINWPSYYSNSDYYVCEKEGGPQVKKTCPPGEIFTFVLQVCTKPNKFIPPPAMNALPTVLPMLSQRPGVNIPSLPKPLQPGGSIDAPVLINPHFPSHNNEMPGMANPEYPPVFVDGPHPPMELPHPPVLDVHPKPGFVDEVSSMEHESDEHIKPNMPMFPGKPSHELAVDPSAPLPPTPAPTPPVVEVTEGPKKPPQPTGTTKKPAALPNKTKPTTGTKKPNPQANNKKPQGASAAKNQKAPAAAKKPGQGAKSPNAADKKTAAKKPAAPSKA